MKRANRFVLGPTWRLLLADMGVDAAAVLAHAGLPADLFNRDDAALSPAAYFQLWRGAEQAAGGRELALLLAEHFRAEVFDAPMFASLCSPNFNTAARRLSRYKPLIGPMELTVGCDPQATRLEVGCYGAVGELPLSLCLSELVFFCQLIRMCTRERVVPVEVTLPRLPPQVAPYEAYFGCALRGGDRTAIAFRAEDAARPFLTANAAMWDFFEGKLNRRLADMVADAGTADRVKAVLLEALPGGDAGIESVAARLAMSKRTLQRRLGEEGESFQSLLGKTRAELADHYLRQSRLPLGEIAFLLGFQEPNSFIRAYQVWRGTTPGAFRQARH